MIRPLALVVLAHVAGCGRFKFDPGATKIADAADSDAAAPTGPWGTPMAINIGITGIDDPSMTGDGLELTVNSGSSVSVSDRPTPADAWSMATVLASLPAPVYSPHLSRDGLTLWVVTNGTSASQIVVTTRAARTDSFGPYQQIPEITSGLGEDGPAVTNDGLVMVFDSKRSGTSGIYITSRPDLASPWGTPIAISEVNALGSIVRPHLTDDRLSLYFQGPGNANGGDIYYASRATATSLFDTPQRLAEVSSDADDEDPWVSADQHVLLLSSNRDGVQKIWQSTR